MPLAPSAPSAPSAPQDMLGQLQGVQPQWSAFSQADYQKVIETTSPAYGGPKRWDRRWIQDLKEMRSYRTVVDENRRLRDHLSESQEMVHQLRTANQKLTTSLEKSRTALDEAKSGYNDYVRQVREDHAREAAAIRAEFRKKLQEGALESARKMEEKERMHKAELNLVVKQERIEAEKRVAAALTLHQKCMVNTMTKRQD